MPDSAVIQLAEAVKTALNGATLSQSFSAERLYLPTYGFQSDDADGLADLKVSVVPVAKTLAVLSRRDDEEGYSVGIGVQKRVSGDPTTTAANAEIDALMLLVEEICDLFLGNDAVDSLLPARFVGLEVNSQYNVDWLEQHKLYIAVITLEFKRVRAK